MTGHILNCETGEVLAEVKATPWLYRHNDLIVKIEIEANFNGSGEVTATLTDKRIVVDSWASYQVALNYFTERGMNKNYGRFAHVRFTCLDKYNGSQGRNEIINGIRREIQASVESALRMDRFANMCKRISLMYHVHPHDVERQYNIMVSTGKLVMLGDIAQPVQTTLAA